MQSWIHLRQRPLCQQTLQQIEAEQLPQDLADCVQDSLPRAGWDCSGHNILYQVWRHPRSNHLFWTEDSEQPASPLRVHLPWQIVLEDILVRGGAILHGGLACHADRGVLFTAPPGGGKSTALAAPPADWTVLADDATLLWPDPEGGYLASPLPTWSQLLGVTGQLRQIERWDLSRTVAVAALMFLEKADGIDLNRLTAIETAYPLYRACSEYPAVILSRKNLRGKVFHNSCTIARAIPAWTLELTRGGPFWPDVAEVLDHA